MSTPAAVNWTKVLSRSSPTVRKTLLDARATHEDLRRQIAETKASIPQLDFSAYRAQLPEKTHGKLIAELEGQVKAFKPVKSVDLEAALKQLDSERQAKLKSSSVFLARLEENIAKTSGQLKKLESAKPVDEVTVEDVYEVHPEYRERIAQAIKADDWSVAAGEKDAKETKEKQPGKAAATPDSLVLDYLQ